MNRKMIRLVSLAASGMLVAISSTVMASTPKPEKGCISVPVPSPIQVIADLPEIPLIPQAPGLPNQLPPPPLPPGGTILPFQPPIGAPAPKPMVAYNGDDNGCVPNPDTKHPSSQVRPNGQNGVALLACEHEHKWRGYPGDWDITDLEDKA